MRKLVIKFLIVFCMGFYSINSFSQNERIVELKDFISSSSVIINIKEDWGLQNVILTSKTNNTCDTVKVSDVQEIDTTYIILEKFLVISYRLKGGTGEYLRHTKIFTVKEGNLYESLSLLTKHNSFSPNGVLQRGYKLIFTINKLNDNYFISLKEVETKLQKAISNKTIKLSFNLEYMIFYSSIIANDRTICIDNKYIKANNKIFKVDLRKESYIFNENMWYQQDGKGCFHII